MARALTRSSPFAILIVAFVVLAVLAAVGPTARASGAPITAAREVVAGGPRGSYVVPTGIHKIKHVIVVMQENRSFDDYFGTFPGAEGIPMKDGKPSVCLPDPMLKKCVRPYVDHDDINGGGPHEYGNDIGDVDGGKMDGFIVQVENVADRGCLYPGSPACRVGTEPDVMGYHTESDIPNYWTYAKDFVLQDHMFEAASSFSLISRLYLVSEWSARCTTDNPFSCTNNIRPPFNIWPPNHPTPYGGEPGPTDEDDEPIYAWTDLTYLFHKDHVSWRYYVVPGTEPDCENPAVLTCAPIKQSANTLGLWNPLPWFVTVKDDKQLGNIQSINDFYSAAKTGTLPAVSWVTPSGALSEHPPAPVSYGQSYVTSLINAVMHGPDWSSTAIFLTWDEWGGFYDNVRPPMVDEDGYGIRIPGLVISPYAKSHYVDHQILTSDAYAKFIEDDFLGGQRLNPKTDGRPDPRPDVREDQPILGNLTQDFNFNEAPRQPVILPVHPATTLTGTPVVGKVVPAQLAPDDDGDG